MLKKFIFVLFSIFLIFLLTNNSYAQESSIEVSPDVFDITGNTPSVEITFNGLEDGTWHHCSILDEKCDKAEDTINASGGTATVMVCAANDKKLRVGEGECGDNSGIYEGNDYFHEGRIYQFSLYEDEDMETKGPSVLFYINHYYPVVTVSTNDGPLEVVVSGDRRPGPSKNKNRNNYQVVIEGTTKFGNEYKEDKCITIEEDGGTATATFGRNDKNDTRPLGEGKYLIKVNERINEGGIKSKVDSCSGGFTFWHINAEIDSSGNMKPLKTECSTITEQTSQFCKKDPNASDIEGLNKLLGELTDVANIVLKCDGYERNREGQLECTHLNTAIGSIPTNPIAFIERLFSIVLSIAGVGALGLLIYGGYNYMVSRGDPEKIKGARETITSAILGLLFIIFSLVILQVIAGDILRLPGFGGAETREVDGGTTGTPFLGDPVVQP